MCSSPILLSLASSCPFRRCRKVLSTRPAEPTIDGAARHIRVQGNFGLGEDQILHTRRELAESWRVFVGDAVAEAAA